jgi:drug/metabolite transporter (DMT)-like permease
VTPGDHRRTSLPVRTDLAGVGFVLLAAFQFGGVVVLGRVATRSGLPVPSVLGARFGVAAVLLAGALVAAGQPLAPARGEGWRLAALGAGTYAVEAAFFFHALGHGTAAAVSLLFFTYPVIVSLVSAALGRGLPGRLVGGALVLSVAGAAIMAASGGGVDIDGLGMALALASAFTFSLYLVGAQAVLRGTGSLTGGMWVSASASAGLAGWAGLTGSAAWPGGWGEWGPVLGMAAFTAGAFVCLLAGLRRVGAVRASVLSATEPLTAALLAGVFLGEAIRPGTVVGGLLILAGAVTASVARPPPLPEPPGP